MSQNVAPIDQFRSEIEAQKAQLKTMLPEHMPVDRFIRSAMIAIQLNPGILEADRQSLFTSLQRCAGDGLVPDNKEAALVEFNTRENGEYVKKVQYMPMVDGVLKRARQSGVVTAMTARVVYEHDQFDYWVDEHGEHIQHRPSFSSDRGEKKLVYAMAKLTSGDVVIEPMTMDDVEQVRKASKTPDKGPWRDWYERMAVKSALHRLTKRLPNSSEIAEMLDQGNFLYEFKGEQSESETALPDKPEYPQERLEAKLSEFKEKIQGGKSAKDITSFLASKYALTESQTKQIHALEEGEPA